MLAAVRKRKKELRECYELRKSAESRGMCREKCACLVDSSSKIEKSKRKREKPIKDKINIVRVKSAVYKD